jgi:formylglycine-generating enzyme required for sulfatase activity
LAQPLVQRVGDLHLVLHDTRLALVNNPQPQRIYPWGDQPDPTKANYADTNIGMTSAVNQFASGAGPYGCVDMAGNVWEWTHSLLRSYPYVASDGREDPQSMDNRVIRGGAFYSYAQFVRCAARDSAIPTHSYFFVGFRVVLSQV